MTKPSDSEANQVSLDHILLRHWNEKVEAALWLDMGRINIGEFDAKEQKADDEALAAINHWHEQQCLREFLEMLPENWIIPGTAPIIDQTTSTSYFKASGHDEAIKLLRAAIQAKYNHSEDGGE